MVNFTSFASVITQKWLHLFPSIVFCSITNPLDKKLITSTSFFGTLLISNNSFYIKNLTVIKNLTLINRWLKTKAIFKFSIIFSFSSLFSSVLSCGFFLGVSILLFFPVILVVYVFFFFGVNFFGVFLLLFFVNFFCL